MSQFTNAIQKPLEDLYDYIEANCVNPSAAFFVANDSLEKVTNGEITLLDPTNPTVFLLESSSIATAAAINESINLLRWQYPSLAESPEELYHHMSDWDYVNRFASPCTEPVGILIGANTLMNNMVRDEAEKCKKAIIPRDTEVTFGNITFTFMYPIAIRYYDTGTLSVSYEADEISNFQPLETNIINYEVRKMPDGVQFIYFQIPLKQIKIDAVYGTIQLGRTFKLQANFQDQFYYVRGFLRGQSTFNEWKEIKITHSDMVYDPRDPTLLIQIEDNILTATLPQIYQAEGNLLGEVKLYIYTTKGAITENLSTFEGKIELRALDEQKDLTVYSSVAMVDVPRIAVSNGITSGGTNGLSFEELRKRVIFNSIGAQQLPVTNTNIEAAVNTKGFELVKNTDMVTNRIFLATQKLPVPTNPRLITPANIGIETFIFQKEDLIDHPSVRLNQERWTLLPKCLFIQENGVTRLLSSTELEALKFMEKTAFVNHMNDSKYLFTPFHWVVDNNSLELQVKPYYLDNPKASTVNFISQNQTLELAVNTASREIFRTETGYKLRIRTLSGAHYKALSPAMVSAQLMFYPDGEKIPVYLKHSALGESTGGERYFDFDLETNYDLDSKGRLKILNVSVKGSYDQDVWVNLDTEFHLFLCTNSRTIGYKENEANKYYLEEILLPGSVPITHESIQIELGKSLDNLWSRARNLTIGIKYQTHAMDVPMTYTQDVYATDPVTGRIFTIENGKPVFTVAHHQGDPVLDELGQPVLKYRRGDPIIDPITQLPLALPEHAAHKEMDILMVDGRHVFVTEDAYVAYNQELVNVLLSWITEDLYDISGRLLEQTKLFFHPKSQLGTCQVDKGDGAIVTINTEQSPELELFVPDAVFRDNKSLRLELQNKAIKILDTMLSGREINNSLIEKTLTEAFGNTVISLKLSGLGGTNDLYYAKVISPTKQLSLKRNLVIQGDGTLIMQEDVKFSFKRVTD